MSTQPIQAVPRSSTPFVTGQPVFFTALEELSEDLQFIMSEAIANALTVGQSDLVSSARQAPGWREIADSLVVDWDGDGFIYYALGPAEREAARLEYGDENTAPSGFLRKIATKQAPILANIVSATISEAFDG